MHMKLACNMHQLLVVDVQASSKLHSKKNVKLIYLASRLFFVAVFAN